MPRGYNILEIRDMPLQIEGRHNTFITRFDSVILEKYCVIQLSFDLSNRHIYFCELSMKYSNVENIDKIYSTVNMH